MEFIFGLFSFCHHLGNLNCSLALKLVSKSTPEFLTDSIYLRVHTAAKYRCAVKGIQIRSSFSCHLLGKLSYIVTRLISKLAPEFCSNLYILYVR